MRLIAFHLLAEHLDRVKWQCHRVRDSLKAYLCFLSIKYSPIDSPQCLRRHLHHPNVIPHRLTVADFRLSILVYLFGHSCCDSWHFLLASNSRRVDFGWDDAPNSWRFGSTAYSTDGARDARRTARKMNSLDVVHLLHRNEQLHGVLVLWWADCAIARWNDELQFEWLNCDFLWNIESEYRLEFQRE